MNTETLLTLEAADERKLVMCNCKKEIEEKLLSIHKDKKPDAKNHSVRLTGYTFVLVDPGIEVKGFMDYQIKAEHPLKKGGYKEKTEVGKMVFSFCPFCGEKYGHKNIANT